MSHPAAPYLAICAIYRNEARYMREWIEFHMLMGVERWFLYNNHSTDDHLDVLAPYIDEGTVVWRDWPAVPGQLVAYQHCIEHHRADARWIAFIDLDEFLFSPTGRALPDVLHDFEPYPGVAVNCYAFGTSGHQTPPPGLVIENYTRRLGLERPRTKTVKAIADPRRATQVGRVPHYFRYEDGVHAVNERFEPVRGHASDYVAADVLRVNHYFTRSQVEREEKLNVIPAYTTVPRNKEGVADRDSRLNEEEDATLVAYGPAVRDALAERAAGRTTRPRRPPALRSDR